jgi:hypothetical protein
VYWRELHREELKKISLFLIADEGIRNGRSTHIFSDNKDTLFALAEGRSLIEIEFVTSSRCWRNMNAVIILKWFLETSCEVVSYSTAQFRTFYVLSYLNV